MVRSDPLFRRAARKNTIEAREGRPPMPLAAYQKEKGIGAAVVEVARSAGRIFQLFRCVVILLVENGRCGGCDCSGLRNALPLSLADNGHEHVFAGVFDGRGARAIVGGEITKGARGPS